MEYITAYLLQGTEPCRLKVTWNSLWKGEKRPGIQSRKPLWKCQHCERGWPGICFKLEFLHQVRHIMNILNPLHNIAGREWGVLFPEGRIPACACGSQLDCRELTRRRAGHRERGGKMYLFPLSSSRDVLNSVIP